MKKILVLLAVLAAASLSFATDTKTCPDKAKCDAKCDKACCQDAKTCKAGCTDKAAATKDAAKPAAEAAKK